jgi:hypothetical protein
MGAPAERKNRDGLLELGRSRCYSKLGLMQAEGLEE